MPYDRNSDLPASVRNVLPEAAQTIFRTVVNSQEARGLSTERAFASAWAALKNQGWVKNEDTGRWHRTGEHTMRLIDGGWLAVFKTGTHTDMHSFTREWTQHDLDSIVTSYATREHEAPLVIGHPRLDDPAYGWCKDVRCNGNLLEVQVHQVVPAFAALIESGHYKKRSVALDSDGAGGWRLRHVGLLGAVPPAVAGLPDLVRPFSTQPLGTHVFAVDALDAPPAGRISRAMRALRDALQHLGEVPESDEDDTPSSPQDPPAAPPTPTPPEEPQPEETPPMPTPPPTSAPQAVALAVHDAEARLRQAFAAERQADADRIAALEAENRRQAIQARLTDLKRQGKVTPAMEKLGLVAFCERLASQPETTVTFAASDGSSATHPLAQWFDTFLAALPKAVEFATLVDPTDDTGRTQSPTQSFMARVEQRATEKGISKAAAQAELSREDPDGYHAVVLERRQNGRA